MRVPFHPLCSKVDVVGEEEEGEASIPQSSGIRMNCPGEVCRLKTGPRLHNQGPWECSNPPRTCQHLAPLSGLRSSVVSDFRSQWSSTHPSDMVSSPLDPLCELVEPQKLHGTEQSGLKNSDPLYLCSKVKGWG